MPEGTTTAIQLCLDRLKAGDPAARDQLIARAGDRLRALTRRMLGKYERLRGFEETDDVYQNAAVRLLRALAAVPIETPADFFRVAALQIRRELINLSRHYFGPQGAGANERPLRAAALGTDSTGSFAVPGESTFDPPRLAAWSELHERIDALPSEERDVFDLIWYHEMTHGEAASLLSVSESTVKRRWAAARLRLAEYFSDGVLD